MTRLRLLVALLGVALLAGCATVPLESSPQVVGTVGDEAATRTAQDPVPGREPDLLVRDFLGTSSSPADRHAAGRRYLTDAASARWDDAVSTSVLANVDILYDQRGTDTASILVRADRVGRLSPAGVFAVDAGTLEQRLALVKVGGQWRIDQLPDGVLLDRAEFLRSYQRQPVYFVDPGATTVVPDPRWLVSDPESLPSRLVDLLLAGPSPQLAPAVTTELSPGVRLRSNVTAANGSGSATVGGAGGVRVDLAGLEGRSAAQRQLLAAQIIWTLDAARVPGPYVLQADGAPLDDSHPDGWTTAAVAATDPAASPAADVGLHAVRSGALVTVTDTGTTPVAGPLGTSTSLLDAALSRDGQQVAAVTRAAGLRAGSGVQLLVGALGGPAVPVAEGASMTRPTWSSEDGSAWVVVDGKSVLRATRETGTGQVTTAPVDAAAVTAVGGPITSLRLSRDGTRAAVVVGGRVELAVVTRADSGAVTLSNPQPVTPAATVATAVDWSGPDSLVVAHSDDDSPVLTTGIEGAQVAALPSRNLSPPVRVVAASPTTQLVADTRGVQRLDPGDDTGTRVWRQVVGLAGPDAVPVLPG
ncbi:MtrAB system accessory lipoprotein LpqB [Rhodococcus aerolatus]